MKRQQGGFTLIELMVSLVLFSLAIAGVLSVAISMGRAYHEQREVMSTEQGVRSAMDFISDLVRGVSPAVASGNVQDTKDCVTGVLNVTDSVTGPDVLDVVAASGGVVTSTRTVYDNVTNTQITVTDAQQLAAGDTLLITDGTTGHLVRATAVNTGTNIVSLQAPGCAPALPVGGYPAGSLVIRALRARFRIGTFDGSPDVLLMDQDADGVGEEPLAENVEDMQIALGVDADANGSITSPGEWAFSPGVGALAGKIRAARITLVVRSANQLVGGVATFKRPAAENHPIAVTFDSFRRRVLKSTVEIRNLGGSP